MILNIKLTNLTFFIKKCYNTIGDRVMNANLIKLQHFFEVDTKIKKEMYNNVPPSENGYLDNNSLCKYTDELENSLIYIFSELKCISLDIFGENSSILYRIEQLESLLKSNFYSCGLDIVKLRYFYMKYISNMDIFFIDAVKNECVGYKSFKELPVSKANSINEILHLIHSYVLNDDDILQSIPVIAQKVNNDNYPIALRGKTVELFQRLYEQFPIDLDAGWTDMVVINEKKMIMMVRDRGHALSIEISLNNNVARIEYFIPKLCNIEMINALPGINTVNADSIGATGVIETDISNLSETLFNFISKVPTDSDMVFERRSK